MKKEKNMKKLWQKDTQLNKTIEAFETEGDLVLDQKLVEWDVYGTLAHVYGLKKIGLLTAKETSTAQKGLLEILAKNSGGSFTLSKGDEDVHTKIENYLTHNYGEVGKKIHTGRSRNDQVLTAMRLFTKNELLKIWQALLALAKSLLDFAKEHEFVPIPGYTHMQKAMPMTVGMWAAAFVESLADDSKLFEIIYGLNNQSPLGSAAGFGVPLALDREYTAKLLGFTHQNDGSCCSPAPQPPTMGTPAVGRPGSHHPSLQYHHSIQQNSLYCQNSRGKIEATVVSGLIGQLQTINKLASDILFFTSSELKYFTVDPSLCTGSSIMPQKQNVDIAELLRSKVHLVLGQYTSLVSLSSNLISGYNRDLQDSKKPLFESLEITLSSLQVANLLVQGLYPNYQKLYQSMTPELFATHKALELVAQGMSFRQAYQTIGKDIKSIQKMSKEEIDELLKTSTHIGSTGNLGLVKLEKQLKKEMNKVEKEKKEFEEVIKSLIKY